METFRVDVKVTGYKEILVQADNEQEAVDYVAENLNLDLPMNTLRCVVITASHMLSGEL